MKSKLKRALHQFLEQERISIESGIVNELTFRMIGLDVSEENSSAGLSLKDKYWQDAEEKEKILFTIPNGSTDEQIARIFDFLKIPRSEFKYNTAITVNDTFALEVFVPEFIRNFQLLKERQPEVINKYRITSAPLLESAAKATLSKYISEAKNILLAKKLERLTDSNKPLVNFISLLYSQMEDIEKYPLFYVDVLEGSSKIDYFKTIPEVAQNQELVAKLNMIKEGIELYGKFHRNQSVLALQAFQSEFKLFLDNLGINGEKCEIMEQVVLDLAGIKQVAAKAASYRIGGDPARMTIAYEKMNKTNAQKLITFMKALGDETCCEGYGYKHQAEPLAYAAKECALSSSTRKRKVSESHSFELDGNFFYALLFPGIKARIQQMAAENLLAFYQKTEKEHSDQDESEDSSVEALSPKNETVAIRVSPLSMFQAPQQTSQPVLMEDTELKREFN